MHSSFGSKLLHFAESVDIVSADVEANVLTLFRRYAHDQLQFGLAAVLTDWIPSASGPELSTLWRSDSSGPWVRVPIHVRSEVARHVLAIAYESARPLWLTASDDGLLSHVTVSGNTTHFINHWKGVEESLDEPVHYTPFDAQARLVVILPLKWETSVFGLLVLECSAHETSLSAPRCFQQTLADELTQVAQAIATVLILRRAHQTQVDGSQTAVERLKHELNDHPAVSPWKRPKVFLASAEKADSSVVREIKKKFSDFPQLELLFWEDVHENGNINMQTLEAIAECKFGVCYFSEPDGPANPNEPTRYRDNLNVVFEAGMLQALTNSPTTSPMGWIPIRERNSPSLPFDFAAERILFVPRSDLDNLCPAEFKNALGKRIVELLRSDQAASQLPG